MFSRILLSTFVFAAISAQASCIHGTSFLRREVSEEGKVKVSSFGYSGTQGPTNWAQLEAANAECAIGKNQSPIVLDDKIQKAASAPQVVIDDVEEAEFENLGTTLETIVNGTTTFEGKDFELKQFHLHTPSEHRINEEYFPVEMHMVHEASDGSIAVIAIPFQLTEDGSTTQLLTSVIQNIGDVTTPGTVTKTGKLEFAELVDAIQTEPLFQYTGSLTTPPCAEGLTFLVMEKPMALDVKTFNSLKSVIKFNARFAQNPLGEPNVLEIAAVDAAAKAG
ncbi:carbonic anhydrase [Marasmius fiardii PR-910]|nr:carbonic anhydrase [Marasmius fiardii PR-910]